MRSKASLHAVTPRSKPKSFKKQAKLRARASTPEARLKKKRKVRE